MGYRQLPASKIGCSWQNLFSNAFNHVKIGRVAACREPYIGERWVLIKVVVELSVKIGNVIKTAFTSLTVNNFLTAWPILVFLQWAESSLRALQFGCVVFKNRYGGGTSYGLRATPARLAKLNKITCSNLKCIRCCVGGWMCFLMHSGPEMAMHGSFDQKESFSQEVVVCFSVKLTP